MEIGGRKGADPIKILTRNGFTIIVVFIVKAKKRAVSTNKRWYCMTSPFTHLCGGRKFWRKMK